MVQRAGKLAFLSARLPEEARLELGLKLLSQHVLASGPQFALSALLGVVGLIIGIGGSQVKGRYAVQPPDGAVSGAMNR
jgi:hypothetical protein